MAGDVDLAAVAAKTVRFTGADLEDVVRRAGLNARARLRRTNRATDLQTTAKGGDADG